MKMGTEKNRAIIGKDLEALQQLILVAKEVLDKPETRALERTLRYFAVCLANSSVAVATLCGDGFGADALKISRSMFENYITFRYLLLRPKELNDFLGFDAVARYKRLECYKAKFPRMYSMFSAEKIKAVSENYDSVKKKFSSRNGKVRKSWCRHTLAEMARIVDRAEMYEIFYRHASSVLHVDPMGLAMLIDGATLEIQPGPTARHIGVAMRMATLVFLGTLSEYSKLIVADHAEVFKRIDGLIGGAIETEGSVLGSLSDAF
jgi:hypothetical protein